MRVLQVIHYPVFGGPHNQALRLADPLRARGFEVVVLLPDDSARAAERLRAGGIEVITLPLHRLRASSDLRLHAAFLRGILPEVLAVRRLIREHHIDLVQVAGLVNPHAALAARAEGLPVVWQLLDTRAPKAVALGAMILVRTLASVIMSTGTAVALAHPGGDSLLNRLVPFFPPVDTAAFRPRPDERRTVRAEWGIPEEAPVVGCVANVNPQKGTVDLVRAFVSVRKRVPAARLVLVGAEYDTHRAYSGEVRGAIGEAGLVEGHDVLFAGERNDVERQLVGFDVFAFAPVPRGEGISTVVLEAMAAGLPVVTTSVAGLGEVIDHGVNGHLVPPLDPESMSAAVVDLLSNPAAAARIGATARRDALERFAISRCVDDHVRAYKFALGSIRAESSEIQPSVAPVQTFLACPRCRGPLRRRADTLECVSCSQVHPVVDGIPILLSDATLSDHDEIDHAHGGHTDAGTDPHKAAQAEHFDRAVVEEFEVTRPHKTPGLYKFLLREKFHRATAPIGVDLVGAWALTVCGGSGMDAEFLARSGARVIASDISLGAARRTQERARRYGLDITPIVADVEHLPLTDEAVDLVLVHDGLHHLERPDAGLAEMARVARRWISVTEPASAAATAVAIRAGIALEREEAGNLVARLKPARVAELLRIAGFSTLLVQRYAMYYHHEPGPVMRALSRPWVFPLVRMGWRLANAIVGGAGNKMVVVATRERPSTGRRPLYAARQLAVIPDEGTGDSSARAGGRSAP